MSKVKENPYDKGTQETLWNTWQHGYNSPSKDDQPYEKAMLEYDTYYPVWMAGYKAGETTRPKTKEAPKAPVKAAQEASSDLNSVSDDALLNELRKRKQTEFDTLTASKAAIDLKLNKLRYLFEC